MTYRMAKASTQHDLSHLVSIDKTPTLRSRLEAIGLNIPKSSGDYQTW
jgi:hypothetical protein